MTRSRKYRGESSSTTFLLSVLPFSRYLVNVLDTWITTDVVVAADRTLSFHSDRAGQNGPRKWRYLATSYLVLFPFCRWTERGSCCFSVQWKRQRASELFRESRANRRPLIKLITSAVYLSTIATHPAPITELRSTSGATRMITWREEVQLCLRATMWDSRASLFSKTGRTRWSYDAYSTSEDRDAYSSPGTCRPVVAMRESPALQQRTTSYRQQRSSWQQDSRLWYTALSIFSFVSLTFSRAIATSVKRLVSSRI